MNVAGVIAVRLKQRRPRSGESKASAGFAQHRMAFVRRGELGEVRVHRLARGLPQTADFRFGPIKDRTRRLGAQTKDLVERRLPGGVARAADGGDGCEIARGDRTTVLPDNPRTAFNPPTPR